MIYGNGGATSNIGALLRLIQEEKSQAPVMALPQESPTSPIREAITGPVMSPESPNSARVVSLRPEGVTGAQGPMGASATLPVVPAAAPPPPPIPASMPGMPGQQGPATPATPSANAAPQAAAAPSRTGSVLGAGTVRLGTTVAPTISNASANISRYLPMSSYRAPTPTRNTVGPPSADPYITPVPLQPGTYTPNVTTESQRKLQDLIRNTQRNKQNYMA